MEIRIAVYQRHEKFGPSRNRSWWRAQLLNNRDPRIMVAHGGPKGQVLFQLANNIVQFYGQPCHYVLPIETPIGETWRKNRPCPIKLPDFLMVREAEQWEQIFDRAPVRSFYEIQTEITHTSRPGVPVRPFEPDPFYGRLMEDDRCG